MSCAQYIRSYFISTNEFDDIAPKAVQNFKGLCLGSNGVCYKGSEIYRVIKGSLIEGGQLTQDDKRDIQVDPFDDEYVSHAEPFQLTMVNDPSELNGIKFCITTAPMPHLDGINVCFGYVIAGRSVIRNIENLKLNSKNCPLMKVVIVNCGQFPEKEPLPSNDDGTGDDWEDYIFDDVRIDMDVPSQVFEAVESIKNIATRLLKQGDKVLGHKKYEKALTYLKDYLPDDLDDADLDHLVKLKFSIYLNTALTACQNEDGKEAIRCATEALSLDTGTDQLKAKAHYRMGLGYLLQKDEERAIEELDNALKLLPGDKAIVTAKKDAMNRREERRNREKQMLSRMFK
jgi:peptidyl-prolyl isomerase D